MRRVAIRGVQKNIYILLTPLRLNIVYMYIDYLSFANYKDQKDIFCTTRDGYGHQEFHFEKMCILCRYFSSQHLVPVSLNVWLSQ